MPRILVTNDDGIGSDGLRALVDALVGSDSLQADVVVVAPARDVSGASASLGAVDEHGRVPVERSRVDGHDVDAWALHGPPGLAVLAARLGAFGAVPDIVVSGVNRGPNTGRSILHSGTVGAALTAQNFGGSAVAVSLDGNGSPAGFRRGAEAALHAVDQLQRCAPGTVLNVNVPGDDREVRGWKWAPLDPFGSVRTAIAGDGTVQLEFRAGPEDPHTETDAGLLAQGWITLTALVGVTAADPSTMPDQLGAPGVALFQVPGEDDGERAPAATPGR